MSRTSVFVYADIEGVPHVAGQLWTRAERGRENATFKYAEEWLANPVCFSLAPALALDPGPFHASPEQPLLGAIGDSAPDRWGRTLMRRAERRDAEKEGRAPRTLLETDYLLLVNDETRQGALRFSERVGGPFLQPNDNSIRIPPLVDLPKLLAATDRVLAGDGADEDLRLLLAPGSSLGGARPKASVRDRDGHLAIAKFPNKGDEYNVVLWEALALTLAAKAGLLTPVWRVEMVAKRATLLLRRFDRVQGIRISFLSAMSMLGARDRETHSYLEMVDALRQQGAKPKEDMVELWARIVFSILISNTDDHLRNHGFLYSGRNGWTLSPLYDVNPVPVDIKQRVLTTAIDEEDGTASLELAMKVSSYFDLRPKEAREIIKNVGTAVSTWRSEAAKLGVKKAEIERMESAFEHEDMRAAQRTS